MSIKLQPIRVRFPLWKFLTQPVFTSTKVILNPFQFQYLYHLQLLECCWERDAIQLLERCWLKKIEIRYLR